MLVRNLPRLNLLDLFDVYVEHMNFLFGEIVGTYFVATAVQKCA